MTKPIRFVVAALAVVAFAACGNNDLPRRAEAKTATTSKCDAATIATDVGREPEDVNGPHDCSGDWGWIDLECEDPKSDCVHSGNIVHRVNGRWQIAGALLQDCAESFTAVGAPKEDAENLYPSCSE